MPKTNKKKKQKTK